MNRWKKYEQIIFYPYEVWVELPKVLLVTSSVCTYSVPHIAFPDAGALRTQNLMGSQDTYLFPGISRYCFPVFLPWLIDISLEIAT